MEPLVSIVIPAFNNELFIAETMRSVLRQTYQYIEIVVADHSSHDHTQDILESLATTDSRIRLLPQTTQGGGAIRNWQRVTNAANGEYLKLVCGDDLIDDDLVARQVGILEQYSDVGLVAGRRRFVDANSKPVLRPRGLARLSGEVNGARAIWESVRTGTNIFGEPGAVMLRTDLFAECGGWDPNYHYFIDEASYVRVLAKSKLYADRQIGASFRLSETQWTARLLNEQWNQAVEFHESIRIRWPEIVSQNDVNIGNRKAKRNAHLRRVAFALLGRQRLQRRITTPLV